jgi:hypothetical protein
MFDMLFYLVIGLSMKFLESDSQGNQHFTFEHSDSYQAVQKKFYVAVESMNPDFIVVRAAKKL